MTGDTRSLVDLKMARVVEMLCSEYRPDSLLRSSAAFTVDSSTTGVDISADLSIDLTSAGDYAFPFAVTIDTDAAGSGEPKSYRYVPYKAWIEGITPVRGDERGEYSFSIDQDNIIVLRRWPSGTTEWHLRFWYYAKPAAVADATVPELPSWFHGTIVSGVLVQFPHMFQGDRQSLLIQLQGDYETGRKKILRSRMWGADALNFRAMTQRLRSNQGFWPSGLQSP